MLAKFEKENKTSHSENKRVVHAVLYWLVGVFLKIVSKNHL